MFTRGALVVSIDGMRVYIRTRRELLGYTQETFAKAAGVPYPTYRDYEGGATRDLKAGLFARAVDLLNIPVEHIKLLGKQEITIEEAEQLASQALTQEERAQAIAEQVPAEDVPDVLAFIRELRANPATLRELRKLIDESDNAQQH